MQLQIGQPEKPPKANDRLSCYILNKEERKAAYRLPFAFRAAPNIARNLSLFCQAHTH